MGCKVLCMRTAVLLHLWGGIQLIAPLGGICLVPPLVGRLLRNEYTATTANTTVEISMSETPVAKRYSG